MVGYIVGYIVGDIVGKFEHKLDLALEEWLFGHGVDLGCFAVGSVDIEDVQ